MPSLKPWVRLAVEDKWPKYASSRNMFPHSIPISDLCFVCQQNNQALHTAACLSEDEKAARIETAQKHIDKAKIEKQYYNAQVQEAEDQYKQAVAHQTKPGQMNYSFDFAQVHHPFDAQQTGPEYFKTA